MNRPIHEASTRSEREMYFALLFAFIRVIRGRVVSDFARPAHSGKSSVFGLCGAERAKKGLLSFSWGRVVIGP